MRLQREQPSVGMLAGEPLHVDASNSTHDEPLPWMNTLMRVPLQFLFLLFLLGAISFFGCNLKSNVAKEKAAAPAKVEITPQETLLTTITLTEDAEKRLGIEVAQVEQKTVQPRRVFGGEVITPSGRSIIVSAPVNGIVLTSSDARLTPGMRVKSGDLIASLDPLLTPERDVPTPSEKVAMASARATLVAAQVTASGDVQRGRAEVNAAKIAVDRTNRLLADRAGSQRAVDDAQAQFNIASSNLSAAEERLQQLNKLLATLEGKPGHEPASTLSLRAPVEGILRTIHFSNGQQVAGGSPLFEVLDTRMLWVRVPVFVDLLSSIETKSTAKIVSLGNSLKQGSADRSSGSTDASSGSNASVSSEEWIATPVDAPPSADPSSASADLYFEVPNAGSALRPGQRVGVELALLGAGEALAIPSSAILYDIHGGSWVYVSKGEHRFERQRVTIRWVDQGIAILQQGPKPGTNVVIQGAAELFGTEFGAGK